MPKLETLLAHTGCDPEPPARDLVSPLHLATTYERAEDGSYPGGFIYARNANPTRLQFERAMAGIEGGASAAAFSSGMAATTAVFQALRPGDHVLIPDDVYYGVRRILIEAFEPWGLAYSEADFSDPGAVSAAIRPNTKLIWAETPSNPLSKITDLESVAEIAHRSGAKLAVDGTWTTPLLQRPIELGADLVMHSVTKYLAGHSDVLGGVVTTREEDDLWGRIRTLQTSGGPVMDPFSAWLAMRGMRSLSPRMAVHCRNARAVAESLIGHPHVEAVYYAGLKDHPGHKTAARQMSDFGGMMSLLIRGGAREALAVAARTRIFTRATSLGGTESLIEHRASVEMQPSPTPANLLRLSIGLEHPDDLITDLEQALEV
ncbi:MAG: aminotransferase class I/II-fold pyridoxal phosphate-dependent enzyme [Rhodothermales bacterium]